MRIIRKLTVLASAMTVVMLLPTTASAEIFKGETAGAGDPVHTMFVAFFKTVDFLGITITGQDGTSV